MPEWRTDQPNKMGWYDCEVNGEDRRLLFWICQLNPKKRFWKDELGQRVNAAVKWTGEPSARRW